MDAVEVILGWLEYAGNDTVVGLSDIEGNTVLHIASLRNQIEVSIGNLYLNFLSYNIIKEIFSDISYHTGGVWIAYQGVTLFF